LLVTTVGCDQITKIVARDALSSSRSFRYLNSSVILEHAENPGAFMSLGASLHEEVRFWIFTWAVAIFLTGALILLLRTKNMGNWATFATTLLVGGGVGNLIDRLHRGTVTDFINLGVGSWRTGIFNIADMAIVAGVIVLFFISLRQSHSKI
jgi:signal peptidase II